MIQELKIWNPNINDGEAFWVSIAKEGDQLKDYIIDDNIYFYTEFDNVYKEGDLISLDEQFAVLEVRE